MGLSLLLLPLLFLQNEGLGTPATAAATPVAAVGLLPVSLWGQLTGPVGVSGHRVLVPLTTASWKEGSGGDWDWVPVPLTTLV